MDQDVIDLIGMVVVLGFIALMLLAPFGIMLGMALPSRRRNR